jgi:TrkA domain protein
MASIEQTELPGVGIRYDVWTSTGQRVGVVHHRSGRRELYVCEPDDPDAVATSLDLSDDEAYTLGEALGVSPVAEGIAKLQQSIEGLAIDWLKIPDESPYADHTIGDAQIRTRTGVSVVAVLRGEQTIPSPPPHFGIQTDDVLVVVGTPEGIAAVGEALSPA